MKPLILWSQSHYWWVPLFSPRCHTYWWLLEMNSTSFTFLFLGHMFYLITYLRKCYQRWKQANAEDLSKRNRRMILIFYLSNCVWHFRTVVFSATWLFIKICFAFGYSRALCAVGQGGSRWDISQASTETHHFCQRSKDRNRGMNLNFTLCYSQN